MSPFVHPLGRGGVLLWLLLATALLATTLTARAHEVRPALLQLDEVAPALFDVTWKVPAQDEAMLSLTPRLPGDCARIGGERLDAPGAAVIRRWRVRCPSGFAAGIGVQGLERTLTSAFVRVRFADGTVREGTATARRASVALVQGAPPAVPAYLGLGVEHILTGYDHLGFVLGLLLLVQGVRRLLWTLTAFTLAHSLTLGAAALGVFGLPQRPVEVLIAFSIAVVAREAWCAARGEAAVTARAPWAVAFVFGLLHGFGFASALGQIGLPAQARLTALVLFNLGVEAGQVLVLAAVLPLLWWLRTRWPARRPAFEIGASAVLGSAAMFWVAQRLLG